MLGTAMFGPFVATAYPQVGLMPVGWYAVGNQTGDYAVGVDLSRRNGGRGLGGATIRSLTASPEALATLQQSIRADLYRGQRVRLSAFVMTGTLTNASARMWMRVDGPPGSESRDDMWQRPIVQATDWTRYDIVLDVPRDAVGISFGALLEGNGQLWVDDVALEIVGQRIALTGERVQPASLNARNALRDDARRRRMQAVAYRVAQLRPVNLSFAEGTRNP